MRKGADPPAGHGLAGRLAGGSVAALAIYGVGAGLAYLAQLAIARLIGAEEYGRYAYVFAWMTVAAYAAALGFDVSLLRFVPAYRAQGRHALALGVVRFAEQLVLSVGTAAALTTGAAVLLWPAAFPRPLAATFLAGAALVPVWALLWLRCARVRASGGVVTALAPERIGRDGLLLTALLVAGPLLHLPLSAAAVMAVTLAASLVALVLVSAAVRRGLQAPAGTHPEYAPRIWLGAAWPLVLIGTMEPLLNRSGVMLLGWLGPVRAAGVFAVAFNIAFLAVLPRAAVNVLFAPAAAHLFARGDREALQALMARTTGWTLLGAVAAALPLWLLAVPLLGWFGPGFTAGTTALRLLLAAQVFAAATGSQLSLLAMTGQERAAAATLAASALGGALLGALLIAPLGLTGAALGTAAALVLWNAGMAVAVQRRLHLRPAPALALRVGFAGLRRPPRTHPAPELLSMPASAGTRPDGA